MILLLKMYSFCFTWQSVHGISLDFLKEQETENVKILFYRLPCVIAQIQVTVIFKMTFIPNLRSLSSFSSSLQFRVRIRVEAQPSLLKRATIIFLIFSFYLDFVFILSWRVTSWNKKIISLQFSYLCFYQSHSYTTKLWTLFIPLYGCHD